MSKLSRIRNKFACAFKGLWIGFTTDNSFKIHIFFTVIIFLVAAFLGLGLVEWVILILVTGLVFVSELFNTAIEYLVRMFTTEYHQLAEQLLDIAAGAVLLAAFTAIVTGVLILGPKLWILLQSLF